MTYFSAEDLFESGCYCALAAIDLDYAEFINTWGQDSFDELKSKLKNSGFSFRGILGNSAIFSFPTPLLDDMRDEIDAILDDEVFGE